MINIMSLIVSIMSSGVIAAAISQYFGRKNLKTSQYITVITSERLKWIEIVRSDMTALVSSVLMHQENSCKIMNVSEEEENILYEAFNFDEIEEQYRVSGIVERELNLLLSRSEIVRKAILLKLKLNPKEDSGIINILDDIITVFSNIGNDFSNSVKRIKCDSLVLECQNMLKREWDKVKEETRKI